MKQVSLKVSSRESTGRAASKHLRSSGQIPAVIYGPSGTRNLTIEGTDFRRLWKAANGRTALIELQTEGAEPTLAIIQDSQRDARTDRWAHVDFKEILRGRDMVANIAFHVTGDATGVRDEGGILELQIHEVGVRCRPRHLPEIIEVDVSALAVGESLYVRDLPKLEGVEYTTDKDIVVVTVAAKRVGGDDDADEEEAAGEPEAIKQKAEAK